MTEDALEFKTANNISISYPKASLGLRLGAYLVDLALLYFIIIIVMVISPGTAFSLFFFFSVLFLWDFSFELFNKGQTPGKMALKIRVIGLDGSAPTVKSLFIRWLFRLIDIGLTLGSLAILSIHGSRYGQRIGDVLANTTVIKTKVWYINDLTQISKLDGIYSSGRLTNLSKYNDEEMSAVKTIMMRIQKHRTLDNIAVFRNIYQKFVNDLHIKEEKSLDKQIPQVRKILEDYIISTR